MKTGNRRRRLEEALLSESDDCQPTKEIDKSGILQPFQKHRGCIDVVETWTTMTHAATKIRNRMHNRIRQQRYANPFFYPNTTTKLQLFVLSFWLLYFAAIIVKGQHQASPHPDCPHQQDTFNYDWETWDYYELLGLKPIEEDTKSKRRFRRRKGVQQFKDVSSLDVKDIRKAYRRTAQIWHPDKAVKNGNTTVSTEESNARFARIAEAYEVLSDPSKRHDYDLFLEYCDKIRQQQQHGEDGARTSASLGQRLTSLWDDILTGVQNRDPFRVFDEFFFADDEDSDDIFDPNDPYSYIEYQQQQGQGQNYSREEHYRNHEQERPVRVFQDKENLYDPMTGENVLRISQTEEYAPYDEDGENYDGKFYYRVVAQEFKQRYDPYTTGLRYVPITEPHVQEEGYRYSSLARKSASMASESPVLESILHSWEVLTPESKLLVSPNHRFVAGLSPDDCELLIMVDDPSNDKYDNEYNGDREHLYGEDDVYWSSSSSSSHHFGGRNKPYSTNNQNCFAILKGPHLIVAMGDSNGYGNRILWYSDAGSEEENGGDGSASSSAHDFLYEYEDEWGFWHKRPRAYLAQLDNDGSLAIYSVWSVPRDSNSNLISRSLAAAKDLYHGRVRAQIEYSHLYYQSASASSVIYKRCVYTTSPMGCFRLGRRLTQLSLEIYFRIKKIISKMNHVADTWLDLIYEEDDIFYSIKESLWKNGHAFGSKMASSSARLVRKVMEYFVQLQKSLQRSL